jgi:lipoyltransferase/lipoate-protein ligase
MAPSRGLGFLLRARISIARPQIRRYSDFVRAATNPGNKSQVYISRSLDPYLNLSIEHYLLQKAPADSTILFLYTNRSSVIIGRNQNPWTEVNLGSLGENPETKCQLVRRRSGGGTVFHDEGNVNYSVICPSAVFNRDKHAEMVVKALKSLGVKEAKVNCRHDIVLDNAHAGEEAARPYKVSGSAYKLTRLRSLHHGTCLLNSGNLSWISRILKAPAKPFIKARGVESVSSAITNVKVPNESFEQAVVSEFSSLYGSAGSPMIVAEPEGEVPEIAKGLEELRSEEWIYEQTPQFTFSSKIPSESVKGSAALELLTFPEGVSIQTS